MQSRFGDEVTPFVVDRLRLAKNQQVILGICSTEILIVKTHFIPDVGYIQCFEGKCCEDEGIPAVRYGLPCYRYQTDGKITIIGDELEFLMLALGYTDYKNLKTKQAILVGQGSDITKADLLVTCTEEQYQKKQFDVLQSCHWRKVLKAQSNGKERYKEDMTKFLAHGEDTFGRVVNEEQYTKQITGISQAPVLDRPSAAQLAQLPESGESEGLEDSPL